MVVEDYEIFVRVVSFIGNIFAYLLGRIIKSTAKAKIRLTVSNI